MRENFYLFNFNEENYDLMVINFIKFKLFFYHKILNSNNNLNSKIKFNQHIIWFFIASFFFKKDLFFYNYYKILRDRLGLFSKNKFSYRGFNKTRLFRLPKKNIYFKFYKKLDKMRAIFVKYLVTKREDYNYITSDLREFALNIDKLYLYIISYNPLHFIIKKKKRILHL